MAIIGTMHVYGLSISYTRYGNLVHITGIDLTDDDSLPNDDLTNVVARQLEERLRTNGLSDADAAKIARDLTSEFQEIFRVSSTKQGLAMVDFAFTLAERMHVYELVHEVVHRVEERGR